MSSSPGEPEAEGLVAEDSPPVEVSLEDEGPVEDSPPARPAAAISFGVGLAALVLTYLAGVVTGAPPYRGLGFWVDENLLDGARIGGEILRAGTVVLRSVIYDAAGNQIGVTGRSSLGTELVVVAVYFLLGVASLVLLRRRRPELLRARGAREALRTLGILTPLVALGATLGVLVGAELFPLETASELVNLSRPMFALGATALVLGIRFVVLGPIAEEVLWRGVIYSGLRARLPAVPAAVTCAMAFVGWHYLVGWRALPALLLQYLFALVACRLTEVTRSLWPALALHVVGNGCAFGVYALVSAYPNEVLYVVGLPR